jgi:hypothetical protein
MSNDVEIGSGWEKNWWSNFFWMLGIQVFYPIWMAILTMTSSAGEDWI